jgi:hypothetical protein
LEQAPAMKAGPFNPLVRRLLLGIKADNLPRLVPKLHGGAVHELLSPFFGLTLVFAVKLYAVLNTTVLTDDVCPVTVHGACSNALVPDK